MRQPPLVARWIAGLAILTVAASASPQQNEQQAEQQNESSRTRIVRAHFEDDADAVRLIVSLEHLEVNWEQGYVVLDATDREIADVRAAGMRVVADPSFVVVEHPVLASVVSGATIPGFSCYRTVEQTFASARDLVARFPALATWSDVGDSWKKTRNASEGYDLIVLSLTNSRTTGTKPVLFVTAALHAREYTTAELALRFAEHLLDSYGVDPEITWLLDHQQVDLMLQANPDGRKRAEQGLSWRKNHNTDHCGGTWDPERVRPGVDLNRNFSFLWDSTVGAGTAECSWTYRGASSASEPETRAVIAHMDRLFPDERSGDGGPGDTNAAPDTKSGIYLDIHSYSELVLYPWGDRAVPAPNGTALATLARKLAWFNDYRPIQAVGLYPTTGTSEDYGYGELGVASFTYELGTAFFQSCGAFRSSILDQNIDSLLYAFKASRLPYQLPAGPDAQAVQMSGTASTSGVSAGTSLRLTATLDDTRFNNTQGTEPTQSIAGAEYTIDVPPWAADAAAHAMSAADGVFDSTVEAVTAIVDTTGLEAGRHTIFVHGRDAAGNWGPVSAAFLFTGKAPPAKPAAPTLTPLFGGLQVDWSAPAGNGAPVTGFEVRYRPRHRDWWSHTTNPSGSTRSSALTGLSQEAHDVALRAISAVGPSAWSSPATATPASTPLGRGTCRPDEETLCLKGSRFEVRLDHLAEGEPRPARVADSGTEESGLFWIFDPANWEVLVKVLDGCSNGAVWVYGASTTDVGYVITVTDTASGEVRKYRNEPGRRATSITDMNAFPGACERP